MSPDPADDELFRRLFVAHFDDLWRFARRRCPSAADADDITAQVFAVAWRRRDELPGTGVRLWLFGVARHVLANHRRSNERQRRLQLRLIDNHRDDHHEAPDLPREELRAALAWLSDDDRDVVLMRCWDGLGITDIAVLLDCTPNAVSVRLHKARRKLIDRLDQTDSVTNGHVSVDPQPRKKDRHGHQ
ncbi:MAG: sigma-70 family RNA polymerase sigma factor [Ilumatobacteraceae bacterium]